MLYWMVSMVDDTRTYTTNTLIHLVSHTQILFCSVLFCYNIYIFVSLFSISPLFCCSIFFIYFVVVCLCSMWSSAQVLSAFGLKSGTLNTQRAHTQSSFTKHTERERKSTRENFDAAISYSFSFLNAYIAAHTHTHMYTMWGEHGLQEEERVWR